jgi:hypothetical protein
VLLTIIEGRKLKKRLEDLEHQVAFRSGSPSLEVKHADQHLVNLSSFRSSPHILHIQESNNVDSHGCSSDAYNYPYRHLADDKGTLSYHILASSPHLHHHFSVIRPTQASSQPNTQCRTRITRLILSPSLLHMWYLLLQ